MSDDSSVGKLQRTLRALVAAGVPGQQLPSTRALVSTYQVSPITVGRAVARLAAEGLVVTVPGRGAYIAARRVHRPQDFGWQSVVLGPRPVDAEPVRALMNQPDSGVGLLSWGYLSTDLQPRRELDAAAARALRRPHAWETAPVDGLAELREIFASAVGADAGDALIVPGTQTALATIFRALAAPGSTVLLEEPTYPGAIVAALAAGLRVAPAPTDEFGLRPDLLAQALDRTGAHLVYSQPTFANPSGRTLAPERRQPVLDVIARAGAFLIEDDWARDLGFDLRAPAPLLLDDDHGHVIYLRSLTKSVTPSLRVGVLIARGPVRSRLSDARVVEDFFVSRPLQEIAIELLSATSWPRHLSRLHTRLRLRRDALGSALSEFLPQATIDHYPTGGLHLWVGLPAPIEDRALAAAAHREGLLIGAGSQFQIADSGAAHLRLSFGAAGETELRTGVAHLAGLIDSA